MYTGDAELAVQKHLADDVGRVSPGGLNVALYRHVRVLGHRPQIRRGESATDVTPVQKPGLRYRQKSSRGQIVQ